MADSEQAIKEVVSMLEVPCRIQNTEKGEKYNTIYSIHNYRSLVLVAVFILKPGVL